MSWQNDRDLTHSQSLGSRASNGPKCPFPSQPLLLPPQRAVHKQLHATAGAGAGETSVSLHCPLLPPPWTMFDLVAHAMDNWTRCDWRQWRWGGNGSFLKMSPPLQAPPPQTPSIMNSDPLQVKGCSRFQVQLTECRPVTLGEYDLILLFLLSFRVGSRNGKLAVGSFILFLQ